MVPFVSSIPGGMTLDLGGSTDDVGPAAGSAAWREQRREDHPKPGFRRKPGFVSA
jgi:hypothetical protein